MMQDCFKTCHNQ